MEKRKIQSTKQLTTETPSHKAATFGKIRAQKRRSVANPKRDDFVATNAGIFDKGAIGSII